MNLDTHLPIVSLSAEDESLRGPIRDLLARTIADRTPLQRARSWLGFDGAFSRELGKSGFLGLGLPKAYGGHERGPLARFVVVEELLSAGAPVAAHWIADRQSGPLILRYGTEAQRQFYLPKICKGEAFFCIGMSEPNSGSDLASVRTHAEKTDKGWRLNGQKIWTTYADKANYMIALVRTSGAAEDRHKGLSQLIIDVKAPGISVRPIVDVTGDAHFCEVHFSDVELPDDALIGREGGGWEQVTAELAYERSGPERFFSNMVLLDTFIKIVKASGIKDDSITATIGGYMAELAVYRGLSLTIAQKLSKGEAPALEASIVKDMGTTFEQRIPSDIASLLGKRPDLDVDPMLYKTLLYSSAISPSNSLRGGTREILRGIIARGLGLR